MRWPSGVAMRSSGDTDGVGIGSLWDTLWGLCRAPSRVDMGSLWDTWQGGCRRSVAPRWGGHGTVWGTP